MKRGTIIKAAFLVLAAAVSRADDVSDCLKAHNQARQAYGLESLHLDKRLCAAAQKHAQYMAGKQKLNHRGPGDEMYFNRAQAAGYSTDWVNSSENIAEGPEEFMDGAFTTRAWIESKVGHKDNVFSRDWRDVGFGVARATDGRLYWCAVYARSVVSPRRPPSQVIFE